MPSGENLRKGGLNTEFGEFSKACKNLAAARRKSNKVNINALPVYMERAFKYIENQRENNQPLTVAGFTMAIGVCSDTIERMRRGELDYILVEYCKLYDIPLETLDELEPVHDFIDEQGEFHSIPLVPFSNFVEKYIDLPIQEQLEQNCYTNKGNPAGSIFGLKARYKWKEDETPQNLTQNLVIASPEQAQKALDMIK